MLQIRYWLPFFNTLLIVLVPIVLVLSVVRILLFPWFLEFEYRLPAFPEDTYGFSQTERLFWARYAVDYLVNDANISYLGDLRFPVGQSMPPESCTQLDACPECLRDCTFLFNARELKHMRDVKDVMQNVLWVWRVSLFVLFILGVIYWVNGWQGEFLENLGRGGWLTAATSIVIVLLVLMAFSLVFVTFHDLFFAPGSWTFLYSDTLIRLFPERFWRDVFLFGLGFPALLGILLGWLLGHLKED